MDSQIGCQIDLYLELQQIPAFLLFLEYEELQQLLDVNLYRVVALQTRPLECVLGQRLVAPVRLILHIYL